MVDVAALTREQLSEFLELARSRVLAGRGLVQHMFPVAVRRERMSDPIEMMADLTVALADYVLALEQAREGEDRW